MEVTKEIKSIYLQKPAVPVNSCHIYRESIRFGENDALKAGIRRLLYRNKLEIIAEEDEEETVMAEPIDVHTSTQRRTSGGVAYMISFKHCLQQAQVSCTYCSIILYMHLMTVDYSNHSCRSYLTAPAVSKKSSLRSLVSRPLTVCLSQTWTRMTTAATMTRITTLRKRFW